MTVLICRLHGRVKRERMVPSLGLRWFHFCAAKKPHARYIPCTQNQADTLTQTHGRRRTNVKANNGILPPWNVTRPPPASDKTDTVWHLWWAKLKLVSVWKLLHRLTVTCICSHTRQRKRTMSRKADIWTNMFILFFQNMENNNKKGAIQFLYNCSQPQRNRTQLCYRRCLHPACQRLTHAVTHMHNG